MTEEQQPIIGRRYELLEAMGRGGMGVVYRATDQLTGQQVALKQVTIPNNQHLFGSRSDDPDLTLALAQEFRALATMRHPHIISVYDFGFDQNRQPYFTMEYVDGGRTILEAGQGQPLEKRAGLVLQMLQALAYLHRRGILHRDLKPANALVQDGQLKLLDFGLSVLTSRTMEHQTMTTAGTMAYLAPEVFQGHAYSRSSDLYAVGVIAFQILTGQYPYNDSNMATMLHDILSKPVDASSFGVADGLAHVLNRLLAKDREERYDDAVEVIADLTLAMNLPQPPETAEIRDSYLQAAKFVGRDAEMAQLTGLLKKTIDGRGAAILISGESGVGKSRLLDELRIQALVAGVLVLQGQAIHDGRSLYQLWRDVLSSLALYAALDDETAAVFKAAVPEIERLLHRDVPDAPSLNPSASQVRLSQSISSALNKLEQPILIILEDLQWAGSESLTLLSNLGPTVTEQAILLVGAYRDDSASALNDQLASVKTLQLDRLSGPEITELSESMLGQAGRDPEVVALLQKETEGNAFFVVEAVRALAEEAGQLDKISDMVLPDSVVASGISALLARRLNRVPEQARPMLYLASVASRVLDLRLLRTLEPELDFDSWLATCMDAAVLEADGETWRFAHDKLREEIKESLDHELHHDLHLRVAEGLEVTYPDAPEHAAILAHHWSVAGNQEKELYYAEIAAHQAAQNNANEAAISYYQRALKLLMTRPETAERDHLELSVQMGLGPPLMAIHGFADPQVNRTYARARELAARTGQIDLLFNATWGQWEFYSHGSISDLDIAEELLQQLFDLASQSDDVGLLLEAHHSGWGTAWPRGDAAAIVKHVKQGLELYDRKLSREHIHVFGHDPGVCAYGNGAVGCWLLGYPDQARQHVLKGVKLAEELGHPFSTTVSQWGSTMIAFFRGEDQVALAGANDFVTVSQKHGFSGFAKVARWLQGIALAQTMEGPARMAHMRKVYHLALRDRRFVLWPWVISKFLEACLSLDAIPEGLEAVRDELTANPLTGQRHSESEIRRQYGELMLAKDKDRVLEAEEQIQLAIEITRRQSARSLELRAVMSLARLWQKQGKRDDARQILAEHYGWFTEGFGTADLIAAKQLLEQLQ